MKNELLNYQDIQTINEDHQVFLVKNKQTNQFYIKKIMEIYNIDIYKNLYRKPIKGIPRIQYFHEINQQLIVIEEFITGKNLEEIIQTHSLTIQTIQQYLIELCDILNQIHESNIVHRDIKPSNIMIKDNGQVILLDFNAAKYETHKESDTRLIGTQGYAAPEQYGFGSSTHQTDIYSFGIVAKEMMESILEHDSNLEAVIQKCTQLNPKDRYATILEVKEAILHQKKQTTYALPGFRTRTPWKMLIGSMTYLFIITVAVLSKNTANGIPLTGMHNLLYKIAIVCIGLIFVWIPCNYMNIQNSMPLCRTKNSFLKVIGILLLIILFLFALLFVCSILETFLFPS